MSRAKIGKKNPEHSERMKGTGNPMYGIHRFGENSPMWGKKNPGLSELNKINNPLRCFVGKGNPMWGKKNPSMSKIMSGENSPNKRPEVREKRRIQWVKNNPLKKLKNKKKASLRMKNGGAAHANSFIKNPSKPQVQLYGKVKMLYPSAVLNYPYQNYSIDIAIPELKIAIEFDGYYHFQKGRKELDQKRQEEIERGSWKFIRYSKLPDDSILRKALLEIQDI